MNATEVERQLAEIDAVMKAAVQEVERIQDACTHVDADGKSTLRSAGNCAGESQCFICGRVV